VVRKASIRKQHKRGCSPFTLLCHLALFFLFIPHFHSFELKFVLPISTIPAECYGNENPLSILLNLSAIYAFLDDFSAAIAFLLWLHILRKGFIASFTDFHTKILRFAVKTFFKSGIPISSTFGTDRSEQKNVVCSS